MTDSFKNLLLDADNPESVGSVDDTPTAEEIRMAADGDTMAEPPVADNPVTEPPVGVDPMPEPPVAVDQDQAVAPEVEATAEEGIDIAPKSRMGAIAAGVAQAANVALPTTAAIVAFPVGAAGAGLITSPTGPAAIAFGFAGGLATSAGAYWATAEAQEIALKTVAPESYEKWNEYLAKSSKEYPLSSSMGQLAPNLITARPSVSNAKDAVSFSRQLLTGNAGTDLASSIGKSRIENLANVVFGGGTELASETVRQATEEGNFDFLRLAAMTIAGSLINKQTKLGKKINSIAGFNTKEVPIDPIITDSDEELGELLLRTINDTEGTPSSVNRELAESGEAFIPNPIAEKYNSLVDFIKGDFSGTEMASDSSVTEMLRLQAKTTQAEKTSDPSSWTPQEKAAYNRGDYEEFSRLRGYTENEIADFKKYQQVRQDLVNKYGDQILDAFDHPDVSEFVYDLEFGVGAYVKKQERLLDKANPDKSPSSEPTPAAIKQAEIAQAQLQAFGKLIDERLSGDLTKRAEGTETLNFDLLNAAITREPERALQALAIVLKDELKVPSLTAEKRAQDSLEWLRSNGYEERISALNSAKQTTDELNYQIIAARYMTEQAVEGLKKSLEKARASNSEEDLASAVSMFLEVKRVLKPAEAIRGNWGRMGHAFRTFDPKQRNLQVISKMMEMEGIDDFGELTKVKSQYVVDMIQKALDNTDPKAFARLATMTFEDKVIGAASEILTGSVMSFIDTGAVNLIGGVGEAILAPINGTLSGALQLIKKSIMSQVGKASKEEIDAAWAEVEASALYYKYLTQRFGTNMKMFGAALKTSEISFNTSLLEDVRGGMPTDRGQRIKDPKTLGQKVASAAYGKLGKYRTQGWITSETFAVDPNKNPMGAILVDVMGEVMRLPHRMIVAADDLVKASNAYAAAHTKLYMEASRKGLKGDDFKKYISERLEILMDNNNKLYSKDRVMEEVRQEVQKEGLEGGEAFTEVMKRTQDRFDTEMGELGKFAERWATQITAQEQMGVRLNGKNTFGKSFENFFRNHPVARLALGQLFIRTPINLVRMTGRYIPTPVLINAVTDVKIGGSQPFRGLKNIQKEYYESFMSGDEFRISQARGRLLTGFAMASLAGFAATQKVISGNLSTNKETRKLQLSRGEIPYAFKIPKNSNVGKELAEELKSNPNAMKPDSENSEYYWIEFKRLHEPTAAIFMVAADLATVLKDPDRDDRDAADIAGMLAMVIGSQLKEKVFLNNFKQFYDLYSGISEDKRGLGRQLTMYAGRRLAPVMTPILENTDPVIYELNSFSQFLARRMPETTREAVFGEDMYLPKSYNLFGEDIESAITGIPAVDFFLPLYVSTSKKDPLLEEMIGFNYNFSSPERYYGNEQGQSWDIRDFRYKGGILSQLAEDNNDFRVFDPEAAVETAKNTDFSKEQAKLLRLYRTMGMTKLPKLGQDAYDRWQENIGQIKINGRTVRESCEKLRATRRYQSLENRVLTGEENPRVKEMMSVISKYRTLALEITKEEYPELKRAIASKKVVNRALRAGKNREEIETEVPKMLDRVLNFPN